MAIRVVIVYNNKENFYKNIGDEWRAVTSTFSDLNYSGDNISGAVQTAINSWRKDNPDCILNHWFFYEIHDHNDLIDMVDNTNKNIKSVNEHLDLVHTAVGKVNTLHEDLMEHISIIIKSLEALMTEIKNESKT